MRWFSFLFRFASRRSEKLAPPPDLSLVPPFPLFFSQTRKKKRKRKPDLRKLSLRQNLLADASRILRLASAPQIEELVLHDNKLTTAPDLSPFTSLRRLELSYNEIRSLAPLSGETTNPGPGVALEELYVASNKVSKIEGLEEFKKLQILELGSNRLRVVEVSLFFLASFFGFRLAK